MLGAICGSAQSMDCAAQSVDPYIAQESMDCAGICGSRLLARSTGSAHRLAAYAAPLQHPTNDIIAHVCCPSSVVIFDFLCRLQYSVSFAQQV